MSSQLIPGVLEILMIILVVLVPFAAIYIIKQFLSGYQEFKRGMEEN